MAPSSLASLLKANAAGFHPVVAFDPLKDRLMAMDLTGANHALSAELLADTTAFTRYIFSLLENTGATFGIGGYAEHRTVYDRSALFSSTSPDEEPRRLHLGTDIWGRPHTPVMAFTDGLVHSFGQHDGFGDYGATIILVHQVEAQSFYSLYGHLSRNSIRNLRRGDRIQRGDIFAEFGIPSDNGQWPPHLHFQLIADLEGWDGDYPGVCRLSEKERWLRNCPDPDLVLQLNRYLGVLRERP